MEPAELPGSSFRLGEWIVHPDSCELTGPDGAVQRLEAKPVAVLVELARQAGRVVSREDLLAAVWGEAFVTEEVLTHCVWELRRALGDKARQPVYLQTIPRKGYRLIATVVWLKEELRDDERWELGEKIGGGAMGEVFRARDRRLHRSVALKFLPQEWSRDPAARRQLLREARAAAALDHPNVCPLYEIGETADGRLFLVLALYEGETLRRRLHRGPLPWPEAVEVAANLAAGLGAAHQRGIVHRDLKPANVFCTAEGEVKLLDFGVARLPGVTTLNPESSPGTPAYMSPEQCRGDAVDPRSDLWSLGVVLYEMLTGRRPFGGDHDQAVIYSILHRPPEPLAELEPQASHLGVPAAVREIVARALEKDPGRRYGSAEEMKAALLAAGRDEGAEGSPPRLPEAGSGTGDEPPKLWKPRSPSLRPSSWKPWALAASLFVLVTAAVLWQALSPPPALRVAVPRPVVESARGGEETREQLAFVAQAALAAALDRLATTPRIAPLSAVDLGESSPANGAGGGSPDRSRRQSDLLALGRAAAADEVLELSLREASGVGLLTLVRLRADGVVLWTDSFVVPLAPQDILLVRDAVTQRLAQAYPKYGIYPTNQSGFFGRSAEPVSVEDYLSFLELRRQVERGGDGDDQRRWLEQVVELTESSPGFLPAHIQLADLARSLFTSTGERLYYDQALAALDRAEDLAPEDPRPQIWRARLLLADRRGEAARSMLEAAERRAPGHPSIPLLQAEAVDLEGDAEEARRILAKAVATFPSWQNLYRLAALEHRDGLAAEARSHLEEALQRSSGNPWVLRKLASLELSHGELPRAAELFAELVGQDPRAVAPRINLGLARFLQGEYEAAAAELETVLASHPDHATAWLNLADARFAGGDPEAARLAYGRVLELLDAPNLRPAETLLRAQALAHLGRFREAVELSQRAVEEQPENAEALFMAALVYSLAGEHHSALVAAQRSLERGMQPVWFRIPAFEPLRADPEFEQLLVASR